MNPRSTGPVEVEIEELVLHGFPESAKLHIAAALEKQLGLLLSQRGLDGMRDSLEIDGLRSSAIEVPPNTRPASVGKELGRVIYRSLSGSTPPKPTSQTRTDRGPRA